jgi:hypothetical protein
MLVFALLLINDFNFIFKIYFENHYFLLKIKTLAILEVYFFSLSFHLTCEEINCVFYIIWWKHRHIKTLKFIAS